MPAVEQPHRCREHAVARRPRPPPGRAAPPAAAAAAPRRTRASGRTSAGRAACANRRGRGTACGPPRRRLSPAGGRAGACRPTRPARRAGSPARGCARASPRRRAGCRPAAGIRSRGPGGGARMPGSEQSTRLSLPIAQLPPTRAGAGRQTPAVGTCRLGILGRDARGGGWSRRERRARAPAVRRVRRPRRSTRCWRSWTRDRVLRAHGDRAQRGPLLPRATRGCGATCATPRRCGRSWSWSPEAARDRQPRGRARPRARARPRRPRDRHPGRVGVEGRARTGHLGMRLRRPRPDAPLVAGGRPRAPASSRPPRLRTPRARRTRRSRSASTPSHPAAAARAARTAGASFSPMEVSQELARRRRSRRLWLAVALLVALALFAIDTGTGGRVTLIGFFAIPPFIVAAGAGRRETAIAVVACVVLALLAGIVDGFFGSFQHLFRVGLGALAGLLAIRVADGARARRAGGPAGPRRGSCAGRVAGAERGDAAPARDRRARAGLGRRRAVGGRGARRHPRPRAGVAAPRSGLESFQQPDGELELRHRRRAARARARQRRAGLGRRTCGRTPAFARSEAAAAAGHPRRGRLPDHGHARRAWRDRAVLPPRRAGRTPR